MKEEGYLEKLAKRFEVDSSEFNWITIEKYDVIMISDIRGLQYRGYLYLHIYHGDHEFTLDELYDFCSAMRTNSGKHFVRPIFRGRLALTVPVIISKKGFSESAIQFVKQNKMLQLGDLCCPVLVDLNTKRLTVLERFGIVCRFPVMAYVRMIRKFFSIT